MHHPAGTLSDDRYALRLDQARAGWDWASLHLLELEPDGHVVHAVGEDEVVVLPLAGSCAVDVDGARFELAGRRDVFAGPSDFVYAPRDATIELSSGGGGRFALLGGRARRRLAARYQPAAAHPVELRGAGSCSRQLVNFCTPQSFEADNLIAVEAYTPSGNWSTYPPHKHDEERADESALEEIYYFEVGGGPDGSAGIGYQRVYGTAQRPIDVLAEVRSGDVVLIPHGWHGPSMAPPGYDLYFLNVMAGPSPTRAWRICDDPAHAWVRDTWVGQPVDPRLPLPGFDVGTVSSDADWGR